MAAALRADSGLTNQAVEERLRYLSVAKTFMRVALEDVELAGQAIMISYYTANRDPECFADPHALDIHRRALGHLAFGHDTHLCLGAQLARVEMRVAFPVLINRFPTLHLADGDLPEDFGSLRIHRPATCNRAGLQKISASIRAFSARVHRYSHVIALLTCFANLLIGHFAETNANAECCDRQDSGADAGSDDEPIGVRGERLLEELRRD